MTLAAPQTCEAACLVLGVLDGDLARGLEGLARARRRTDAESERGLD